MDKQTIYQIQEETKKVLPEIFGENMLFGFICGGFSKGYANEDHDIDTFICVKESVSREVEKKYLDWYFDIHKRFGIKADYDYPGEVVVLERLLLTIEIVKSLKLTLKIDEVRIKKAIIWTDMITSYTAAECGSDLKLLYQIKEEYKHYPQQWKEEVLALITPEEREEWKDKSHLLIMERFMKYPKYDGKGLEKIYGQII
jgi:hypothetical protein